MKISKLALALACACAASAASASGSDDLLVRRASMATGIEASKLQIEKKETEPQRIDFTVKSSDGRKFACYVSHANGVSGPVVSDALCNEIGASGAAKPISEGNNALMDAFRASQPPKR